MLERMAMEMVRSTKLAPRLKDGKPVAYTARAPFHFAVDNDEGPEAAKIPEPHILKAIQPVYPPELAEKGEVGGVIFDMAFAADGSVKSMKTLRASNPAFEQAAMAAVKQWSFSPAKKEGAPVETRGYLAIGFETDARRPEWKWLYPPRPSVGYYAIVRRTQPDQPPAGVATPAPGSAATGESEPKAATK
jgi:protein TonB